METQWRLEDIAREKRPTPEQKKWVAEKFIESTTLLTSLASQYGFNYKTVFNWIQKVRANTELKPYGKVTTTVSLSVLESCPLVVELRSRGLTPYEPVKVLQPDLKRLIANEYRRGVLPASVIGSLVGISGRRVYSYAKKVKINESCSFNKTDSESTHRRNKRLKGSSDIIESDSQSRVVGSTDTTCDEMDENLDTESM